MLTAGSPSPSWTALDHQGAMHESAAYRGKWLLLYFYPKDDTPGCTIEACGLRDAWHTVSASSLSVLGVSADSAKSHQSFIAKYALPFPLLVDDKRELAHAFGADGTTYPVRTSFLIDPSGTVRSIYRDFDCNDHAEMVLRDLQSMQAA